MEQDFLYIITYYLLAKLSAIIHDRAVTKLSIIAHYCIVNHTEMKRRTQEDLCLKLGWWEGETFHIKNHCLGEFALLHKPFWACFLTRTHGHTFVSNLFFFFSRFSDILWCYYGSD